MLEKGAFQGQVSGSVLICRLILHVSILYKLRKVHIYCRNFHSVYCSNTWSSDAFLFQVSNNFYFTFTVQQDSLKNGKRIRNVVPGTEEEARRVIERMDAEKS